MHDIKQRNSRRRSESLDPSEHRPLALNNHRHPHHHHRRNLSMEPQELARDLAAAVDGLNLIPLGNKNLTLITNNIGDGVGVGGKDNVVGGAAVGATGNTETAHDYAEIYTPSREKAPLWLKGGPPSGGSSTTTTTSDSTTDLGTPRPPTPPLHRFPSWEAKIYQVANDGLAATGDDNESSSQEHTDAGLVNNSTAGRISVNVTSINSGAGVGGDSPIVTGNGTTSGSGSGGGGGRITSRSQTVSGGYCDISVPVYATVKGVSLKYILK